jgi:hypothetical protein
MSSAPILLDEMQNLLAETETCLAWLREIVMC